MLPFILASTLPPFCPLTPTLSPSAGERENLRPRFGGSGFSLFSAEEGVGGDND